MPDIENNRKTAEECRAGGSFFSLCLADFRAVLKVSLPIGKACGGTSWKFQKGRKGAGVKGGGVANCRIFRSAVPSVVVWSTLLVSLSGVKKKL